MSAITIPLVGEIADEQMPQWLECLSDMLPSVSFLPLCELSQEQKISVTVAVVANPSVEEIAQLPNLIWVQSLWAGVESTLKNFPQRSFKIVRMIDPGMASRMAESVLTWSLYLHRDIPLYARAQSEGRWHPLPMILAEERHITVLGLGELGRASAMALLEQGFQVSGWSRTEKTIPGVHCFSGRDGLKAVLSNSDILVCLLPLTTATEQLLNADFFALCRPGVQLINFGRGRLVDDQALLNALDKKLVQHAVLDVFTQEPLPADHPFWTHPDISVLPHISAQTNPKTASKIVAENLTEYLRSGKVPAHVDQQLGY